MTYILTGILIGIASVTSDILPTLTLTGRARASLPCGWFFLLHWGTHATFLHRQYHRLSIGYKYKTSLHDYLSSSNISVSHISAFLAMMHSFTEFFLSGMRSTLRTGLTCPIGRNLSEVDSTLPAHPFEDFQETTPSSIQAMLCQHPATGHFEVQVLSKDHPSIVAKFVSRQEMELTPNVVNVFMQFTNLGLSLPVVGRAFFLVSQFALQQSLLARANPRKSEGALPVHLSI